MVMKIPFVRCCESKEVFKRDITLKYVLCGMLYVGIGVDVSVVLCCVVLCCVVLCCVVLVLVWCLCWC